MSTDYKLGRIFIPVCIDFNGMTANFAIINGVLDSAILWI